MRDKIIQLLDLKPAPGEAGVSDDQILETIGELKHQADAAATARQEEKAITDLVNQSCGALSRHAAKEVLASRAQSGK